VDETGDTVTVWGLLKTFQPVPNPIGIVAEKECLSVF
jgi:hypothetical protein